VAAVAMRATLGGGAGGVRLAEAAAEEKEEATDILAASPQTCEGKGFGGVRAPIIIPPIGKFLTKGDDERIIEEERDDAWGLIWPK